MRRACSTHSKSHKLRFAHKSGRGLATMGICRDDEARHKRKALGGNRAAIFVYVMEGLENMAFLSNAVSLVIYFYGYMNFSLTKSATTLTNFLGTSFLLALFGGFISDTYISRFKTAVVFGLIEVVGFSVLTAQAYFPQLRPTPCILALPDQRDQCQEADSIQTGILFLGLYLVAVGTSGVKAALPTLGADQFDEHDPNHITKLSSFFNWFLFSFTIGAMFGVTFVVWIATNKGWDWSFGLCTVAVLLAVFSICMGNSVYRINVPQGSPLLRIFKVFVVAVKHRKHPVPETAAELYETPDDGEKLQRTDQFRFLDLAAVRSSSGKSETWNLCSVTQVEEAKILVRMCPIIICTIFMNTCLAQLQTFTIQQGTTMDPNLLGFKVPAASIPFIPLFFMFLMIPVYEHLFVPLARKFTKIPTGIRNLQRIGVGLVLSAISMGVAGLIETRRKAVAVEHNMVNSLEPLPYSLFWLGIQYAIFGAADMFTLVGLMEFFYAESSLGMKSLATAISWSSLAFGYYISTVVVQVVNAASGGWLSSNNLNKDKLDYFYWLLAVLSVANFGFYLVVASWYKYRNVEKGEDRTMSSSEMVQV